jgi:predicted ATPase
LDWSYELLSNTERGVLQRLSVLPGPFGLQAALDRAMRALDAAAHATLAPVYNRFLEGFETQDLVIARAVLGEASAGS